MKNKQSFLVDIGETMIDTRNTNCNEDNQVLFCECGHSMNFNSKIKRSIIKNFNELVEGEEIIEKIVCPVCKKSFDDYNKICLLSPDKEEVYNIQYSFKEVIKSKSKIFYLYKTSEHVVFSAIENRLVFREETDFIEFDEKTKEASLNISKYDIEKKYIDGETDSLKSVDIVEAELKNGNSEKTFIKLTIRNIVCLESFFTYFEFVNYVGLQDAFEFFNKINKHVSDLEKLKKESFINFMFENYKIETVDNKNGTCEFYQYLPSGFDDGKFVRKKLNVGNYLKNLENISKLFFSIVSFPNLTTVFLTKDYKFLKDFTHSNYMCDSKIYKEKSATFPIKIIEISMNYDKNGNLKEKNKGRYFKISNIIYKNINTPSDINIIYEIYAKNVLEKQELETLFLKYENNRLYKVFRQLTKSLRNEIILSYKHICHILDNKLDDFVDEFLTTYVDTINVLDLLGINNDEIFKIKSFKELSNMHNDYTAKYNVVKDKEKSRFYENAIKTFEELNIVVDDVKFTVMPTVEELNKEGVRMHHCIYTYLERICERKYLAVNVQHIISNERATMGLIRNQNKLTFEQLKGYQNSRATSELILAVINFCRKNDIECSSNMSDLNPNNSLIKRMSDYLTDEEVVKKRKKIEEERLKKENKKNRRNR